MVKRINEPNRPLMDAVKDLGTLDPDKVGACKHENFFVDASINRLEISKGNISDYIADIVIRCDDCKLPFQFRGLKHGLSGNLPTTDITNIQARLPIVPADGCLRAPSKMPGFSVTNIRD